MAMRDHLTRVSKLRAQITSVDTENHTVDVIGADYGARRIMVWEVPAGFRWPIEGESWSIYEENGNWYLGSRATDLDDDFPITSMNPGDQRLDSDFIYDKSGNRIATTGPEFTDTIEGTTRAFGRLNQFDQGRNWDKSDFDALGTGLVAFYKLDGNGLDSSGNNLHLTTKGTVTYGKDAFGNPTGAMRCEATVANFLYRLVPTNADSMNLRSGTWGCMFRTPARLRADNMMFGRFTGNINTSSWWLGVVPIGNDQVTFGASYMIGAATGIQYNAGGGSLVTDDRWHIAIVSLDAGSVRVWIDGRMVFEKGGPNVNSPYLLDTTAPFVIGGMGGSDVANNLYSHMGLVDNVFMTSDVYTDEEIRYLCSVKINHSLTVKPRHVSMTVTARSPAPDFTQKTFTDLGMAAPLRLYNFSGATPLVNLGTNTVTADLTAVNGLIRVNGPNGLKDSAVAFNSAHQNYLEGNDAGLPFGTVPRSFGCWVKLQNMPNSNAAIIQYGNEGFAGASVLVYPRQASDVNPGALTLWNGTSDVGATYSIWDGKWHFYAFTMGAGPASYPDINDGWHFHFYIDGRLQQVAIQPATPLATILKGAAGLRISRRLGASAEYGNFAVARWFICDYQITGPQILDLYMQQGGVNLETPVSTYDKITTWDEESLYVYNDSLTPWSDFELTVTR